MSRTLVAAKAAPHPEEQSKKTGTCALQQRIVRAITHRKGRCFCTSRRHSIRDAVLTTQTVQNDPDLLF